MSESARTACRDLPPRLDGDAPCLVWETTKACALTCGFCRQSARTGRHFRELSTLDAVRMLNELRAVGRVCVLLAGGDPQERPDLPELVEHAARQGLRPWITLCPTAGAHEEALATLAARGLEGVLVRSAGPDAARHDLAAGFVGGHARLEELAAAARELGLRVEYAPDGHVPATWALHVEHTGVVRLAGGAAGDARRDDVAELVVRTTARAPVPALP